MLTKKTGVIFLIFFFFILNGIQTERNLHKSYDGKHFKFSTGFLLFQTGIMIAFISIVKLLRRQKIPLRDYLNRELFFSGFFQALSVYSTIMMSVKVDYLFNVLLRSSKFLSVLIGALVFRTHGQNVS